MTILDELRNEVEGTQAALKTAHPANIQYLMGRLAGLAFAIKKLEEQK